MDDDVAAARELTDAAQVHTAREEVRRAISALAASPLDERASDRMRRALRRSSTRPVRDAVRRLNGSAPTGPVRLAAVPTDTASTSGDVS